MRLAASTREMLDRHIERAFLRRFGAAANLRHAVRKVVLEMVTGGASDQAIRTLLRRSGGRPPAAASVGPRLDRDGADRVVRADPPDTSVG
jgi:hypothetical protein